MNAQLTIAPIILAAGVCAAPSIAAERAIEVSDDGQVVVDARFAADASASSARGDVVPYPLTPDWQNDIRRQVGGLQVADMNGDGWNDVVVGCYISNSFPPYDFWHNYIYYNTGGSLEASPSWTSDDQVSTGDVQVGDIDGDGYLDIFSANGGGSMAPSRIYYGGPTGPDTTPDWASAEPDLAWNNYAILYDFDQDGDLDVFTANQGNSTEDPSRPMFGFFNDNGSLSTTPGWQSAESSLQNFLAFGDYDGDGWADLAVSKWVNYESGVYRNVNGSMQTTPAWTTGDDDSDKGVAWADVDDDGWLDLALGHDPTLLYGNAAGALSVAWSATASYFGHSEIRFADVDHDGDPDLAETHFANGYVNIYLNNDGVLESTPSWTYDSPSVGTAIAFGDINGDGLTDLVVGNSGDVSVKVFYNQLVLCPADLTGDDQVNSDDLFQLLGAWGPCPGCPEDLTGDDQVNADDLFQLLGAWGPCG